MTWAKLPAVERVHSGCLNCGSKPVTLPLESNPHPGFGMVGLRRDGEHLDNVEDIIRDEDIDRFKVQDFEDIAAGDPDHDWRIHVDGPLSSAVYQRHGEGEWVAVETGMGFA